MEIEEHVSTADGVVIRYVGRGTFLHDLPRLRASGESFVFRGVVALTVTSDGEIARTEEYYGTDFVSSVDRAGYHHIEG
jgi:hypothetical protein